MVDVSEVMSLRQVVPDIPHLGGQYEPDMPHSRDCTDEVLKLEVQNKLRMIILPIILQFQHP